MKSIKIPQRQSACFASLKLLLRRFTSEKELRKRESVDAVRLHFAIEAIYVKIDTIKTLYWQYKRYAD